MKVLRKPALACRTGMSIATINRRELAGEFPRRIQLGPNLVGWLEEEVDAWLKSRPRGPIPLETASKNPPHQNSAERSTT